MGQGHPPVFLHASFRTSSTWLWTKFRADPRALAFNEVFNDILGRLSEAAARTHDPGSWRSGHPPTDPYFLEYLPLIRPAGGVAGYRLEMAVAQFVPPGGAGGNIPDDETRYLSGLIALAWRDGKVPVLADTRTLARLPGLKRAFGGYHIFLCRNLLQQWNSYSNQHQDGNPFFIETICSTLFNGNGDQYIEFLYQYMTMTSGYDPDLWMVEENYDHLFEVFVALHLYLSMLAYAAADLTIDVNEIARDAAIRVAVERRVHDACGLSIDLADVRIANQQPLYPLRDPDAVWRRIAIMVAAAIRRLDADAETAGFGRRLLADAQRAAGRSDGDAIAVALVEREAFYSKLLYHHPDSIDTLLQLSLVLLELGKPRDALNLCNRAIQLAPNSIEVLAMQSRVVAALANVRNTVLPNQASS